MKTSKKVPGKVRTCTTENLTAWIAAGHEKRGSLVHEKRYVINQTDIRILAHLLSLAGIRLGRRSKRRKYELSFRRAKWIEQELDRRQNEALARGMDENDERIDAIWDEVVNESDVRFKGHGGCIDVAI